MFRKGLPSKGTSKEGIWTWDVAKWDAADAQ